MTPAVGAAPAILDDAGLDVAVLDHHRVVEHGHVGHAAVAVAGVEVGAKHGILFRGRRRGAQLADDVGIAGQNFAEIARGTEFVGDHPHRDAGAALVAGRTVGDRLAAAEAAMGQQIIEVGGLFADQMREHLALVSTRQVRAGGWGGQVELGGVAGMLCHRASIGIEQLIQHRLDRPQRQWT